MARRMIVLAALALVGWFVTAGPAAAQTGYGETVSVQAGEQIRQSGVACPAGGEVQIQIDGVTVATTTAAADGTWTVVVTIPSNIRPGTHTLTGVCDGRVVQVQTLSVGGAGARGGGGVLARTGSDVGVMVGLGLAAIVVGGSFVYGARADKRKGNAAA